MRKKKKNKSKSVEETENEHRLRCFPGQSVNRDRYFPVHEQVGVVAGYEWTCRVYCGLVRVVWVGKGCRPVDALSSRLQQAGRTSRPCPAHGAGFGITSPTRK